MYNKWVQQMRKQTRTRITKNKVWKNCFINACNTLFYRTWNEFELLLLHTCMGDSVVQAIIWLVMILVHWTLIAGCMCVCVCVCVHAREWVRKSVLHDGHSFVSFFSSDNCFPLFFFPILYLIFLYFYTLVTTLSLSLSRWLQPLLLLLLLLAHSTVFCT